MVPLAGFEPAAHGSGIGPGVRDGPRWDKMGGQSDDRGGNGMSSKTKWRVLAAVVVIVLLALLGYSCSRGGAASGARPGSTASGTSGASGTPEAAVKTFFDAATKHGTLTFISGKERKEDRVEYWVDGSRFRLTWFNADGSVRLHMISPDGKAVYHCRPEDETSVIAYTAAEKHQWIFNGPPGWAPDAGVAKDGLTAFTFSAKKLWDVAGASQQFYLEDLVVYSDGARVVKVVTRTNSHTPESADDLVTSDYVFNEPELDGKISQGVFELPYEIVAAK